jgi:SAM-dependent methyltransferase
MIEKYDDPIGMAILDYAKTHKPADIIVCSDICEDDIIPVEVLFRDYNDMPALEKAALDLVKGKTLDVGAGAGVHARELLKRGFDVEAIELSLGAVAYMTSQGIKARKQNFFELKNERFDTLLFMMNGLGIAGTLANLENTLQHAKTLLQSGGRILCDSSDIKYLYEEEDGSMWVDLNTEYYGNFRFQMQYKKHNSSWFDWLYVDFDTLFKAAKNVGLVAKRVFEQDDHYLAELTCL